DLLTQASGQIAIAVENALAYRQISELKDKLALEKLYLEEEIRIEMNFESIVGNSPALKCVLGGELVALIEPHYPKAGQGRPPVGLERMLRIYFLQQWFNLSDPAVEDALYDSLTMRGF